MNGNRSNKQFRRAANAIVVAAGLGAAAWWGIGQFIDVALSPTIEISGSRTDPQTGRASFNGIVIALPGGATVTIGEAGFARDLSFIGAAEAAENVGLKDVSFKFGDLLFKVPQIDIIGSSLRQADFKALIEGKGSQSFATRLSSFAATTVAIADATIERTVAGTKTTIELRKIGMRNVTAGKAAAVLLEGGSLSSAFELTSFGAVNATNLDLAFLTRLVSSAPGAEREPRLLYTAASVDKVEHKTISGAIIGIAQFTSSDARFQPGSAIAHLLPVLGQLKASNVTVELRGSTGAAPPKWTIKEVAVVADSPRDGIPTKFRAAISDMNIELADAKAVPSLASLLDLGYRSLKLTAVADAEWNPQSGDFTVKDVRIDGNDIGSIAWRATLGKVTKNTFLAKTFDKGFGTATVKTMNVTVEDKGLYERVVAREAKKSGQSVAETRRDLSIRAVTAVTLITQGTADLTVPNAVAKFVSKPGKLNVSSKAKIAAGVPLADFGAQANGQPKISGKFDVVAAAE